MSSQEESGVEKGWRVKVYRLSEGKWLDQGTGMVECKYVDRINNNALQVISDGDPPGRVILESAIASEEVYHMQGDMIIMWTEPSTQVDLALSFEDIRGCEDIWSQLCSLQGKVSGDYSSTSRNPESRQGSRAGDTQPEEASLDLPAPTQHNLDRIAELLAAVTMEYQDSYVNTVLSPLKPEHARKDISDAGTDNEREDHSLEEPSLESNEVLTPRGGKSANPTTSAEGSQVGKRQQSPQEQQQEKGDKEEREGELSQPTYLAALIQLFPKLEAAQDVEGLHNLFSIFRSLVLYNDMHLIDTLLSDEHFEAVVGILEYDPEVSPRPKHREFVRSQVEHKMVVPIKDTGVIHKIHQCFRIRFLKDVLLPRALDEKSISLLNDMDMYNGVIIASSLHSDPEYLHGIFNLLRAQDAQKRGEGVACLQELCSLAKKMQVPNRNAFYRSLIYKEENFFGMFERILGDEDSSVAERLNIGDILKLALQHDAAQLRNFILNEDNQPETPPKDINKVLDEIAGDQSIGMKDRLAKQRSLFAAPQGYVVTPQGEPAGPPPKLSLMGQLLKRLVYDSEAGMQAQASEILRMLLDPETMEVSEKEEFLTMFYQKYIQWLVLPLEMIKVRQTSLPQSPAATQNPEATPHCVAPEQQTEYQLILSSGLLDAHTVQDSTTGAVVRPSSSQDRREAKRASDTARVAEHHITELLSFCVQTHGFRIKYFVLSNNIISKVLRLLHSKDKHLVLGAIRFARTCVGLKDDFYNRHIVRFNLFGRVFEIFATNGPRNNLINSAVMELLEFIRMENIRMLVSYIVENFGDVLQSIDYVDTYSKLKNRYLTNKEDETRESSAQANSDRTRTDNGSMDFGDAATLQRHNLFHHRQLNGNMQRRDSLTNMQQSQRKEDTAKKKRGHGNSPEVDKLQPSRKKSLVPYSQEDEDENDDEGKEDEATSESGLNGKGKKMNLVVDTAPAE